MDKHFDLQSAPTGEHSSYNIAQAIRFKSAILLYYGREPTGCYLSVAELTGKRFIRICYDSDNKLAVEYAVKIHTQLPDTWEALYPLHPRIIKRIPINEGVSL